MIVKNEETNIRRALSWAAGIAEEQIVVDTGSTDRTVEIAREMGAKVYSFSWTDDFSAAKNFAISKASGQWIAFLDADEYLSEEDAQKLPGLLKQLSPGRTDGIMTAWVQLDSQGNVTSNGTQVRLFPNRKDLSYQRRIHEQLAREDGKTLRMTDATQSLAVIHTGYASADDMKGRKFERNIRLIKRELEDHPEDYEMLGYLGDVYCGAEQWDHAEASYQKAVGLMPPVLKAGDQRSAATFLKLIQILDLKHAPEEQILSLYQDAMSREELKKDADFDYLMARWYLKRKDYQEALSYLLQTLKKLETYGTFGRAMYASAGLQEIYEQTAVCQKAVGNYKEAVSQSVAVLQADPWSMTALWVLFESFHCGGVSSSQADLFLDKIYDKTSLKTRIFLLRSAGKADWPELEVLFRSRLSPEELACFKRSMEKN